MYLAFQPVRPLQFAGKNDLNYFQMGVPRKTLNEANRLRNTAKILEAQGRFQEAEQTLNDANQLGLIDN